MALRMKVLCSAGRPPKGGDGGSGSSRPAPQTRQPQQPRPPASARGPERRSGSSAGPQDNSLARTAAASPSSRRRRDGDGTSGNRTGEVASKPGGAVNGTASRAAGSSKGTGYSAADAPEMRKNPELYTGLGTQTPHTPARDSRAPATSSQPQPQPMDPDAGAGSALHESQNSAARTTAHTGSPAAPSAAADDGEDGPAVTYMVSSSAGAVLHPPSLRRPMGQQLTGSGGRPLPHKPEVLAPVGGWPQLRAAVENGADAVYFGLEDFNARARASNFTLDELPEVMSYLRARGVKGFVAFNVLVFDEELAAVEARVAAMARAGVDAVIVQDWGVVDLMRRVAPNLPVHGSTQMSVTSAEGARWVSELGVERVVVGRELSVREIAKVAEGSPGTEVEAFVHGALCVSYSGQCFSSEAWGGRSANRGQCAQACRLPYGLLVDGVLRELGDVSYLLSPQDLMAVEQVPDLIRAGVSCFKVEGRLKGPEYVALTTQVYRRAVDAAWSELLEQQGLEQSGGGGDTAAGAGGGSLTEQQRWDLEQVFARGQDGSHRGLTPGFLEGSVHQRLVRGRAPRHRGVYLGVVESVGPRGVTLTLQAPLKRGDGVAFDEGQPEQPEQGGAVYDIGMLDEQGRPAPSTSQGGDANAPAAPGSRVVVSLGPGQVDTRRVAPGQLLWRTSDPALEARLRSSFEGLAAASTRRVGVGVAVAGGVGQPLTIKLTDPEGRTVTAATELTLSAASKRPMQPEDVLRAIGPQLGCDTLAAAGVDLDELDLAAGEGQGLFLPASEIKAARRRAVDALLSARQAHPCAAGLAEQPLLPGLLAAAKATAADARHLDLIQQLSCTASTSAAAASAAGGGRSSSSSGAAAGEEAATSTSTSTAADGAGLELGDGGSSSSSSSSSSSRRSSGAAAGPSGRAAGAGSAAGADVCIRVLCRSRAQVEGALQVPWLREVVLDFLEVHGLKEAVAAVRASGRRVVVATPRILKPDEERLLLFYLRLGADALLLRSAGMMQQLRALGGPGAAVPGVPYPIPPLEGDFSLNAANVLSADLLLRRGELARLAPTHDLHAGQLAALARGLGPRAALLETVVHQHLPIFHTEHCVFCRFLSSGNSYKDCGHPCESHTLHLRDQAGADHLVLADMGCRNTVFNAKAQSGVFFLRDLVRAGYRTLRVELVDEHQDYVAPLLEGYRSVLMGQRGPGDLWRWLGMLPDANGRAHGVAAGSLEVHKERSREDMKATAATLKQQQQQQQQQAAALAAAGR